MQDLKDFLVFALKNPLLWGVVIAWLVANIQWLVPSVPKPVLDSAIDLLTTIGTLVVAYLGGRYVENKHARRAYAANLIAQTKQETPHG